MATEFQVAQHEETEHTEGSHGTAADDHGVMSDEHGQGSYEEVGYHGEGDHAGPFPPFDPEYFVPQLVWLVITFGLLYVLMSRVALPRVGGILEARRERIAGDLEKAAELREQSDEAIASYEKALADARAQAHKIAGETRETMKAETDALRAEADAKVEAQLAEAETRIAATKDKALAGVREVASETAVAIVSRLTGESADSNAVVAAVDGALGGSR